MSNLAVKELNNLLVIDSRLIADNLGIAHKNLLATIDKHKERIESAFGKIAFETRKSNRGKPERFAWLTEEQATFLMTLSRNTSKVVACKLALVKAFSEAKQIINQVIPAQSQEMERMRLALELMRAKQRYQESGQSILAATSPAVLAYLRGDGPPPIKVEYRDRFIDANTGQAIASVEGSSLTQLIADAGLNPKSTRDRSRVKNILRCRGWDYDTNQGWSSTAYLREFKVLPNEVYEQALRAVVAELATNAEQPNLFVYQFQHDALPPSQT